MNEKKKKQPTWTEVKKVLSEMRREELINTIDDLYKLRKENKQFLLTRYKLVECSLVEFIQKIAKAVNPSTSGKFSFRDARRAVSDYKKATGDMDGVAQLMVFYCKECANSIRNYGNWEQYADATINIWFDTLKHIQKLPKAKHAQYWEELKAARVHMGGAGWGVSDSIDDYMYEYAPVADEDNAAEEGLKPLPHDDMW